MRDLGINLLTYSSALKRDRPETATRLKQAPVTNFYILIWPRHATAK
jgi:hypothetical protein